MISLCAEDKKQFSNNLLIPFFPANTWEWMPLAIEDSSNTMQRDRDLFESVKTGQNLPYIRFYKWKNPTVSFGRTYNMDQVPREKLTGEGWSVVQRPTGGGTVLHKNDLCFSLAWQKNNSTIPWRIAESYLAIHKWIRSSLKILDVECTFQTDSAGSIYYGNDLCFKNPVCSDLLQEGKKIVGGAQWRSHDTALHQGSIQLDLSETRLEIFQSSFQDHFKVRALDGHVSAQ